MTLSGADFAEFFAALNDGHTPFAWQQRLVDHILATGRWPDVIASPTGTGKSSVVDVHVFVNAVAALGGDRVPRRLSAVVNRRALVDSQEQKASRLAELLASPEGAAPIIATVSRALGRRRATPGVPLRVVSLRGGLPRDRTWVDDPTVCTIVCATPDMWGSRLLFRGYGSSRRARPREAGLLGLDSVMVLDEAHLNRQLLRCARTIGRLIDPSAAALGALALQVVETTATPTSDDRKATMIGVDTSDCDSDAVLARRIRTPKPTTIIPTESWPKTSARHPGRQNHAHISVLADHTEELHRRHGLPAGGRTVGCLVNTVGTAITVAAELRRRGRRVEIRVGPMRPWDLEHSLAIKPGLYTLDGDPDTEILVATQTVEVGIDIDLGAAVTELASGPALAQRAGRVNRIGRSESTEFRVLTPPESTAVADYPPYRAEDLDASLTWLKRRAADRSGMAPEMLLADPPPVDTTRRLAFQTPTSIDAELWAQTSDVLVSEPSLDLFLRDSLDKDPAAAGLVVRADLPSEDTSALALLKEVPPQALEVFPAKLSDLNNLLPNVLDSEGAAARAFLLRDGNVRQIAPEDRLRPGDVIVLDDIHAVATAGVVTRGGDERVEAVPWDRLDGIETVLVRPSARVSRHSSDDEPFDATYETLWRELRSSGEGGEFTAATGVESRPREEVDDEEVSDWIVLKSTATELTDEEIRQTRSASARVLLADHRRDVSDRCHAIGSLLGLRPEITEQMRDAGLHHDDGKADPRFQLLLGADEELLAKSGVPTGSRRRGHRESGDLPVGWRHEQLSVLSAESAGVRSDLVLRLVGTSHGCGRPWFPHASSVATDPALAGLAAEKFDHGGWAEIIERTHREFGVWGCAYLEALVRAADGQVSGEGR